MTEEDHEHVTLAVELRCNRCGGTHLVALTGPDQTLDDHRVGCPHCDMVGNADERFTLEGFAALAAHPGDVDAMDDLDDHPTVDWLGAAQARDYFHVHLKGLKAVDWAEERGVASHTVRGAISRAKKAMREHV